MLKVSTSDYIESSVRSSILVTQGGKYVALVNTSFVVDSQFSVAVRILISEHLDFNLISMT